MKKNTGNGFTLIELMVIIALLAIVAGFTIPSLVLIRTRKNENQAVSCLGVIVDYQKAYKNANDDGDGGKYATTLSELSLPLKPVNGEPGMGIATVSGYRIILKMETGTQFHAFAVPLGKNSGTKTFFVDETGVVRMKEGIEDSTSRTDAQLWSKLE